MAAARRCSRQSQGLTRQDRSWEVDPWPQRSAPLIAFRSDDTGTGQVDASPVDASTGSRTTQHGQFGRRARLSTLGVGSSVAGGSDHMVWLVSRRDAKEFEPLPVLLVIGAAVFVAAAFVFFRSGDLLTGAVFLAAAIGFLLVGALLWIWLSRRGG